MGYRIIIMSLQVQTLSLSVEVEIACQTVLALLQEFRPVRMGMREKSLLLQVLEGSTGDIIRRVKTGAFAGLKREVFEILDFPNNAQGQLDHCSAVFTTSQDVRAYFASLGGKEGEGEMKHESSPEGHQHEEKEEQTPEVAQLQVAGQTADRIKPDFQESIVLALDSSSCSSPFFQKQTDKDAPTETQTAPFQGHQPALDIQLAHTNAISEEVLLRSASSEAIEKLSPVCDQPATDIEPAPTQYIPQEEPLQHSSENAPEAIEEFSPLINLQQSASGIQPAFQGLEVKLFQIPSDKVPEITEEVAEPVVNVPVLAKPIAAGSVLVSLVLLVWVFWLMI